MSRTVSGAPVRIGVVGVGSLGQHHARVLSRLPAAELSGIHDVDLQRATAVAGQHGCRVFDSLEALLAAVDAVSIAVPTSEHYRVARACVEAGKDVLVEKPLTATLAEGEQLIRIAGERGRLLQVGHVERFNPAIRVLQKVVGRPRFIEVHRLGVFTPRSLDVDVVLDLMIHDLDLVLSLDGSAVCQVEAVGVPVLTAKVDIANARIRFASGLIANLTASRVSNEKVRKFRVFCSNAYVSIDLAAREGRLYSLQPDAGGRPAIVEERHCAPQEEPLALELAAFVEAVRTRQPPPVSGADGLKALTLAHQVLEKIHAAGEIL